MHFIAVKTENLLSVVDYNEMKSKKCRLIDHCIPFGKKGNDAQQMKRWMMSFTHESGSMTIFSLTCVSFSTSNKEMRT